MKGYLLKEDTINIGEGYYSESNASEHNYVVVFEDDKDTGYFYAAEKHPSTGALSIVDMVFIYDAENIPAAKRKVKLSIIWSGDWHACALVLDNTCHAVFDFRNHRGYNLAGFPPPVLWKNDERELSAEIVSRFFS